MGARRRRGHVGSAGPVATWLGVAATGVAAACAGASADGDAPRPVPEVRTEASATAPAASGAGGAVPPPSRADLLVPEALWRDVLAATGRTGGTLGYTSDEMRNYGGRAYLLRTVENLFRDARSIPRETGRIAEDLLANSGKPHELVRIAWGLTDVSAGRMLPAQTEVWEMPAGVTARVNDASTPAEVFQALSGPGFKFRESVSRRIRETMTASEFGRLPVPLQRFLMRVHLARVNAGRWVRGGRSLAELQPLWNDEWRGQSVSEWPLYAMPDGAATAHAFGAVFFAERLDAAIDELRPWLDAGGRSELRNLEDEPNLLRLIGGDILLLGPGDDTLRDGYEDATLVVDVGGNDRWSAHAGRGGSAQGLYREIGVAIDLAGNDQWGSSAERGGVGCGANGVGVAVDLDGDDRYDIAESGLGCGWSGTGLLIDERGDDRYEVHRKWGQGAGNFGAGILCDLAGDDEYVCAEQAQGFGSTAGAGILLDVAGNDRYVARDDGNVSALYLGQSVAMAQGCGYGRRADLGDGRSLAGGWGVLVDGAGDDTYSAQCWAQGVGYWWGVGVLEDLGGNDTYDNGKYSLGAAAHFAVGCHVDLAGDDRYNLGNSTAKNQYQGHARDGSIGVSIDGHGDDRYFLRPNCAGSADLASVGLFWDRSGDDEYTFERETVAPGAEPPSEDWARPPFGTATVYRTPHRSFRDDLGAFGVFLDTGGRDVYPPGGAARDGATWRERPWANSFGFGFDGDLPPAPAAR